MKTLTLSALSAIAMVAVSLPAGAHPAPKATGIEAGSVVTEAGWRCGRGWHWSPRWHRCVRNW